MNRTYSMALALLISLSLAGCAPQDTSSQPSSSDPSSQPQSSSESSSLGKNNPETPPELAVKIGGQTLPVAKRQEHWNGTISCGTDLIEYVVSQNSDKLVPAASGAVVELDFGDEYPDSVRLMTSARAANGHTISPEATLEVIDVDFRGETGSFTLEIPQDIADGELVGFMLESTWGENNCWYAFAVAVQSAE